MTIYTFVGKLTRYFLRFLAWLFYDHQWAEWELLTIATIAVGLLLLIVKRLRKGTRGRVYADQVPERSPIIGVKLADPRRRHQGIEDLEEGRLVQVPKRDAEKKKSRKTTEQREELDERIERLQHEITEHKQAKEDFKQQAAELTVVNERLRHEITERNQAEKHLKQQAAELTAANEQLQHEIAEREQAEKHAEQQADEVPVAAKQPQHEIIELKHTEQHPKQRPAESPAADEQLLHRANEHGQAEGMFGENTEQARESKRPREPLDVQKLKAIAALAKQIRGRPRHG
jgi:chromosome segregation ATPase